MGKHFAKELLGFPCTVLANTPSLEDSRLLCGSRITDRRSLDWPLRFQQWALRETCDQPQGFEACALVLKPGCSSSGELGPRGMWERTLSTNSGTSCVSLAMFR